MKCDTVLGFSYEGHIALTAWRHPCFHVNIHAPPPLPQITALPTTLVAYPHYCFARHMDENIILLKDIWSEIKKFCCVIKAIKFALVCSIWTDQRPTYNWGLGTKYDVGSCIDSLPSAVTAKKLKQNIAKNEYLNLLFDFLALFVPGEERKYCWIQLPTS